MLLTVSTALEPIGASRHANRFVRRHRGPGETSVSVPRYGRSGGSGWNGFQPTIFGPKGQTTR